jgi:hypothetical protein
MTKSENLVITTFTSMATHALADGSISGFSVRCTPEVLELMLEKASPLLGNKNPISQVHIVRSTIPHDARTARVQAAKMCGDVREALEAEYARRIRGGKVPA